MGWGGVWRDAAPEIPADLEDEHRGHYEMDEKHGQLPHYHPAHVLLPLVLD